MNLKYFARIYTRYFARSLGYSAKNSITYFTLCILLIFFMKYIQCARDNNMNMLIDISVEMLVHVVQSLTNNQRNTVIIIIAFTWKRAKKEFV